MASDRGKMWFELGMRSNVTEESQKIIAQMQAIEKATDRASDALRGLSNVHLDKVISRDMVDNAKVLASTIKDVSKALESVAGKRSKAMVGINVSNLTNANNLLTSLKTNLEHIKGNKLQFGDDGKRAVEDTLRVVKALTREFDKISSSKLGSQGFNVGRNVDLSAVSMMQERILKLSKERESVIRRLDDYKSSNNSIFGNAINIETDKVRKLNGEIEALQVTINKLSRANIKGFIGVPSGAVPRYGESFGNPKKTTLSSARVLERGVISAEKEELKTMRELERMIARAEKDNNRIEKQRASDLRLMAQELVRVNGLYQQLVSLEERLKNSSLNATYSGGVANTKKLLEDRRTALINGLYANDTRDALFIRSSDNVSLINNVKQSLQQVGKAITDNQRKEAESTLQNERNTREKIALNNRLLDSYDKVSGKIEKQRNGLLSLRDAFLISFSTQNLQGMFDNIVQTGGQFEIQKTALQGILRNNARGNAMFSELKEQAKISPYTFSELAQYTKSLAAYQIPYEDLQNTTKRLADLSAGLGVDMNRLILAYGQVNTATILRGQEVRQFTEAGVPILKALADEFTRLEGRVVTTGEVFDKISKKEVPFTMVKKVIADMTSETGQFYNMQGRLSDTLLGKYNNLRDAWEIMLGDFAKGTNAMGATFKLALSGVTELINNLQTLSPLLLGLGVSFGGKALFSPLINSFGSGANSIDNNILKSNALVASNLAMESQTRQLTAFEKDFLRTRNQVLVKDYERLAVAGRLNKMEIMRLHTAGKINANVAKNLYTMVGIESNQAKVLSGLKGWNAALSIGKLQLVAMKNELLAMTLLNPSMWIMAGITAITAGISAYYQAAEEERKRAEDFVSSMEQRRKSLKDALDADKTAIPTDNVGYKKSIDILQDLIKEHSANYDAIMLEANGIEHLSERYEYLKKKVQELERNSVADNRLAGVYESSTDGGLFGEGLKGNIEDYKDALKSFNTRIFNLDENKKNTYIKTLKDLAKAHKEFMSVVYDDKGNERPLSDMLVTYYRKWRSIPQGRDRMPFANEFTIGGVRTWGLNLEDLETSINDILDSNFEEMMQVATKVATDRGYRKGTTEFNQAVRQSIIDQFTFAGLDINDPQIQNLLNNTLFPKYNIYPQFYVDNKDGLTALGKELEDKIKKQFGGITEVQKQIVVKLTANNSILELKDLGKKEYESLVGKLKTYEEAGWNKPNSPHASEYNTEKKKIEEIKKVYKLALPDGDITEDVKKHKKGSGASKVDSRLKELEELERLYDRYKGVYNKLSNIVGKEKALAELNTQDGFKKLSKLGIVDPTDIERNAKKIRDAYERLANENKKSLERTKRFDEAKSKVFDASADVQIKSIKKVNEALQEQMRILNKQWDRFKEWKEATGDISISAIMGFGTDATPATNATESARVLLQGEVNKYNANKQNSNVSVDELLNKLPSELEELIGKDSSLYTSLMYYKDALEKAKDEESKLWLEVYKDAKNYDVRLNALKEDYLRRKEIIDKQENDARKKQGESFNSKPYDRLRNDNERYYTREQSKIGFEQFKDGDAWTKLFENKQNLSLGSMNNILNALYHQKGLLKGGEPKDMKELQKAIDDLKKRISEITPFETIRTSRGRISALSEIRKEMHRNGVDSYVASDSQRDSKAGLIQGKSYSIDDINDNQVEHYNRLYNSINQVISGFTNLQTLLTPISELFDSLGNKGLSNVLNAGSKALSATTNTFGAMRDLSKIAGDGTKGASKVLNKTSPYVAAAMGAVSVVSGIIKLSRNKGKEEYEAQKKYQEASLNVLNEINKNIIEQINITNKEAGDKARLLEDNYAESLRNNIELYRSRMRVHDDSNHSLRKDMNEGKMQKGGILKYGVQIDDSDIERMRNKGFENFLSLYSHFPSRGKYVTWDSVIPSLNKILREKFNDPNGDVYFDGKISQVSEFAGLPPEILATIKELLPALWGQMDEEARKILDNIIELSKTAKDNVEKVAKTFAGLSTDLLHSSFTDALIKMNGDFTDFSNNIEKSMQQAIIGGLATNILGDKIKNLIDKAKDYATNDNALYDAQGNKLNEITKQEHNNLYDGINNLKDDFYRINEVIKDLGLNNVTAASANNRAIKGITEQQADLLLSYTNSIRAYVAQIQENAKIYAEKEERSQNLLAEQVALQKKIEANTYRGANATEGLLEELRSVIYTTSGGKKLRI